MADTHWGEQMNRFYQPRESWEGRFSINGERAGDHSKTIGKWVFGNGGDDKSPVGISRAAYLAGLDAIDALRSEHGRLAQTKRFTPLGLSEAAGEYALTNSLPALKRARVQVDRLKAELVERKSKLTIKKPDPADTIGEMQRAEMRKALREMNDNARREFINSRRDDPSVVQAIVHAPAALSGVHGTMYENMLNEQLNREHGEALGELNDLAEVVSTADQALSVARSEARTIIGCAPDVFEQIAKVAETNGGELPFRVEQEADGREVAKVYDFAARRWRDARPEEVRSSQDAA